MLHTGWEVMRGNQTRVDGHQTFSPESQFSRASLVFDQMGKCFRELRFNLIAPGVWRLSAAAVACLFLLGGTRVKAE